MTRGGGFPEFRAAARAGRLACVTREFTADTLTPVAAYAAIRRPPFGFLLESLVGGERWARYTFLGTEPRLAWRYRAGQVEAWEPDRGWGPAGAAPDPLAHLAVQVRRRPAAALSGLPRFVGGAVGYLAYDAVRRYEPLGAGPADDLGLPDALFVLAETLLIFDNAFGRAIALTTASPDAGTPDAELKRAYDAAVSRLDALLDRLQHPAPLPPLPVMPSMPPMPRLESPFPADRFLSGVERIKQHIGAGDVFQAVLSRRLDVPCPAPPFQVYRALRALNPAPYLYHLDLDDLSIVGSSPEVLVRVEDGEVTVRPIAGTRPRGATDDEDARLAERLRADPKELAEHAMLVDLGRNDVGRVAAFGSVRVTADRALERYSHVQHLVSEVRGRLRPGMDALDALRAAFPAGTVTGAPKVRAMQILDALEPTRRGPYAGAVGYVGWGAAALDTAIAIRTAVLRGGRAHVQAGAGIVADSDPGRELEETEAKARAVLAAVAQAGSREAQPGHIFSRRGRPA
ncbi:MAG TPA: chorismate-binding protein [Gemmatimonadales bacterium]|nr:chorismate-binding protein [Gemmatimonadales bacterium]